MLPIVIFSSPFSRFGSFQFQWKTASVIYKELCVNWKKVIWILNFFFFNSLNQRIKIKIYFVFKLGWARYYLPYLIHFLYYFEQLFYKIFQRYNVSISWFLSSSNSVCFTAMTKRLTFIAIPILWKTLNIDYIVLKLFTFYFLFFDIFVQFLVNKMNRKFLILTLPIMCCFVKMTENAKILVVMPLPARSHFSAFQPFFEELVKRGDNLTIIAGHQLNENVQSNYTLVDVKPLFSKLSKSRMFSTFHIH